jgi:LysM repeat protein
MTSSRTQRSLLIFSVLILLLVVGVPLQAQSGNLLTNPGFEAPFVTAAGAPPREVAQGWTPWHVPTSEGMSASENVQPEYYPASDTVNGLGVPRILSGDDAQQYFSFFATHVGGVYQTVSGISVSDPLRFSVQAYLWSSTFDDPDLSEEDGGVVLQVGIDPTGGTDGTSASIVWSEATQNYDTYAEYTVTTDALATTVTVFVRSTVSFPVRNNVIYLDDASLVIVRGGNETPDATVVPSTASNTAVPATVTNTSAPASATNTTVPPTNATTQPTVEGATNTAAPPTATNTNVPPTATNTSVPPTATNTPTNTPSSTPTATNTVTPSNTPTNTPIPPTATNTFTPSPSPTLNRTQFPNQIVYTVATGDTVALIARRYGSSVQAIVIVNQLNEDALIFVGQQLIIPVNVIPTSTFTPSITPTGGTPTPIPPTASFTPIPPTPYRGPIIVYIVQPGDSISTIAVRFGTTVEEISRLNNILNPNLLFVGQRLNVPSRGVVAPPPSPTVAPPTRPAATPTRTPTVQPVTGGIVYRVQYGDSLYSIAVRFGVSLSNLIRLNRIANPSRIFVGQTIIIP